MVSSNKLMIDIEELWNEDQVESNYKKRVKDCCPQ